MKGQKRGLWKKRGEPNFTWTARILMQGTFRASSFQAKEEQRPLNNGRELLPINTKWAGSTRLQRPVAVSQVPLIPAHKSQRLHFQEICKPVINKRQSLLKIKLYTLRIKWITLKITQNSLLLVWPHFIVTYALGNYLYPLELYGRNIHNGICTSPQLYFQWHHVHSLNSAPIVFIPQILANATNRGSTYYCFVDCLDLRKWYKKALIKQIKLKGMMC